ncbi:hypothetical protein [uncultured Roseobacter sp.]|uniref:hypothetical protein n=1 Tax=uncultured Roseobacter sp. TaxID=114847 RepID=UPI002627E9AC|nr:hypothetical protein [uncultured Roseobacter sp.]
MTVTAKVASDLAEPEKDPVDTSSGKGPDSTTEPAAPTPNTAAETAKTPADIDADAREDGASENNQDGVPSAEDLSSIRKQNIVRALRKAQSMLTFAIDKGIELNAEVVTPINTAVRAYGTDEWTGNLEDEFFAAYSRMSRELGDVSSESIEWSRKYGSTVTFGVAFLGFLALLALIWLQYRVIYLHDSSSSYVETEEALILKEARLIEVGATLPALQEGLVATPPPGPQGTSAQDQAAGSQERNDRTGAMETQISELTREQATLNLEIDRLETQLRAQYAILSEWVTGLDDGPAPEEPGWLSSDEDKAAYDVAYAEWRQSQERLDPHEFQYGVQQALSQLRLLNDFILPAIYGLLGTVAFVLRQISVGLQSQSLSLGSMLNYLIRLPLGGLAGIAVGLLLRPDEATSGLEALQPLALAFVAGYSVELVFAAMDRLVGAFSGDQRQ